MGPIGPEENFPPKDHVNGDNHDIMFFFCMACEWRLVPLHADQQMFTSAGSPASCIRHPGRRQAPQNQIASDRLLVGGCPVATVPCDH